MNYTSAVHGYPPAGSHDRPGQAAVEMPDCSPGNSSQTQCHPRPPRNRRLITISDTRVTAALTAHPADQVPGIPQPRNTSLHRLGSKDDLLGTITELRDRADQDLARHAAMARGYLAGLGPFPERAAVVVLTGRYLADLADTTRRWADWATTTVENWPDDLTAAQPDWATYTAVTGLTGPLPATLAPEAAQSRQKSR